MFERFTDGARRAVVLAQEEARMLRHNYIGTEHLLLGMIHEGEGIAATVLNGMGIDLQAVRREVEQIIGRGQSETASHIPFTPRSKRVMEHSLREAMQHGHPHIGTGHLLLGLVREGEGVGVQILQKLGADRLDVRRRVVSRTTVDPEGVETPVDAPYEFREEVSVAAQLATEPRCPRCLDEIGGGLRARTETAADDTGEGRVHTVLVVWCGNCGMVLGTHPSTGG